MKQSRNKAHPKGNNEARATMTKGMREEIWISGSKSNLSKQGRIRRTGDPYHKKQIIQTKRGQTVAQETRIKKQMKRGRTAAQETRIKYRTYHLNKQIQRGQTVAQKTRIKYRTYNKQYNGDGQSHRRPEVWD